jgi:hypothetical protein
MYMYTTEAYQIFKTILNVGVVIKSRETMNVITHDKVAPRRVNLSRLMDVG